MTGGGEPRAAEAVPADLPARLAEDLATFDAHKPGLAGRLAAYVLEDTDADALATITTLDTSKRDDEMLIVRHYRHPHMRGYKRDGSYGYDEHPGVIAHAARNAILFGPTPLPMLRRYADIAERVNARYGTPGTSASPDWFRAFLKCVGEQGRFLKTPLDFGALTTKRVLALLAPDEHPIASLIDCCFDGDRDGSVALGLPGLGATLVAEIAVAWGSIAALPAKARAQLFEAVGRSGDPAAFHLLVNGLFDSARSVREAATLGLKALPVEQVRTTARSLLGDALPARRSVAIDMLAASGDLAALEAHAGTETSKPLQRKLAPLVARVGTVLEIGIANPPDGPGGYTALDGTWVAAPPLAPDADTLPPDAAAAIAALDWVREAISPNVAIGPDCPCRLVALMNGEIDPSKENQWLWQSVEKDAFLTICARPDIPITCLTRLCLSGAPDHEGWFSLPGNLICDTFMNWGADPILVQRFQAGGDLRHVLGATAKTGYSLADNVRRMLDTRVQPPEDEPLNPTVWAVIANSFEALDEALHKPNTSMRWSSDNHALSMLDVFPKTPARCLDVLVDRAIGGLPKVRAAARRRLEETGDVQRLIVPLLGSKDAAVRTKAAQWLGGRRADAAVAPLRDALAGETSLDARAALLAALVACGDDVTDQFSEELLAAEAADGLRKTRTNYSVLFDRDRLPALRWADGRPVPAVVVQYWFARAHKLKRPGGDPLLHMALDRLDRGDAGRLGASVLAAFIAADTQRPDLETANTYAEANAETYRKQHFWINRDLTHEMAFAMLKKKTLASYVTTAIDHRGLLALTRHTQINQALALTQAFLRDHAKRLPQSKALVEALTANPDSRALQAVVAVARTHANLGLRKHAGALVDEIAEANCWSTLELADRMMPTADLDENGGLDLPIGGTVFRAVLGEGSALALHDADGRPAKALPRAKTAEERAEGAAARKQLAAAGKALDAAITIVMDRFYQAMCAGRSWSAEGFAAIVLRHPIANLLAQRTIFVGLNAYDAVQAGFRRLPDGSLTDVEDASVDVSSFARVAVAHRSSLGDASADAWRAHLADYDIAVPFDQLSRPLAPLHDPEARHLDDFRGHVIGARTLGEVAARLGYTRGRVGDPGSFNDYEKRFVDLGFACVISMSDAPLDKADDTPVKLWSAYLRRHRPDREISYPGKNIRLGRAPPILVSELWHDFKAIADAGSGLAPDAGSPS